MVGSGVAVEFIRYCTVLSPENVFMLWPFPWMDKTGTRQTRSANERLRRVNVRYSLFDLEGGTADNTCILDSIPEESEFN
jgi:hypothetical protein